MINRTQRTIKIVAIIMLALGAGGMQKIASANAATPTFPNYTFSAIEDRVIVEEMAVMEEMSETIKRGLQPTAQTHTTTTFPNYTIIGPVHSFGHASSGPIAPRKQGFSPWVQTNP